MYILDYKDILRSKYLFSIITKYNPFIFFVQIFYTLMKSFKLYCIFNAVCKINQLETFLFKRYCC